MSFFDWTIARRPQILFAVFGIVAVGGAVFTLERSTYLRADSVSVCISVLVIGVNGGDPGEGCIAVIPAAESSSSSSSVSSGGSSFSSAASVSNASVRSTSGEQGDNGARRHTLQQSRSRILRLIRTWTERDTLHAAPSSSSASSAWYDDAVRLLKEKGFIDDATDLRIGEDATRAEVAKLIVLFSGSTLAIPDTLSFDDALPGAWYAPFIEQAAGRAWMLGYDNCYGRRPCYFRPGAVVTRAEAAAVLVRVFHLPLLRQSPPFSDVPFYAWYHDSIRAAADACVLRGDDGRVRPDDLMTRGELFVMVARAFARRTFDEGCGDAQPVSTNGMDDSAENLCTITTLSCLRDAVQSDITTFFLRPLGASLLELPGYVTQLMNVPAAEVGTWFLLLSIPVGIIFLAHRMKRKQGRTEDGAL